MKMNFVCNCREAEHFGGAVGADAHIGPPRSCEFAENFCKNGLFCRADVDIGPYAKFERPMQQPECKPAKRSQSGKEETSAEDKKTKRKFRLRFGKKRTECRE